MSDKNAPIGRGYRRGDGRIGIRNRLLIIYCSSCARHTAESIASHFSPSEAEVIGFDRCVSSSFVLNKMICYATHPNVGAVLTVSNGCEPLQDISILEKAEQSLRPVGRIVIAKSGGIAASVDKGIREAERLLCKIKNLPLEDLRPSDLVIGSECGGSDTTSGLAANPVVGRVFDRLCDIGATVMFEEMYEAIGLKDVLLSRAANKQAVEDLARTYDKFFQSSKDSNQFFITPGNMNGGLTTIEEKSMGAVVKSGTRPIQGVLKIAEKPAYPGLWMMDSMTDTTVGVGPYVSEDATSLLVYPTCGVTLTILTSGRGHLINTPIAPTVKITGNRDTYSHLMDDIDLDASSLLDGRKSLDELADELQNIIYKVAAGQMTKGEALGHKDGVINQELQFERTGCML